MIRNNQQVARIVLVFRVISAKSTIERRLSLKSVLRRSKILCIRRLSIEVVAHASKATLLQQAHQYFKQCPHNTERPRPIA
jgi:hypothetical protein